MRAKNASTAALVGIWMILLTAFVVTILYVGRQLLIPLALAAMLTGSLSGHGCGLSCIAWSDRKNKLGLSVAIGAGVGAALGVALHHLAFWLSLGCVGGIVTGIILTRMAVEF
jgi:hypothetical protein